MVLLGHTPSPSDRKQKAAPMPIEYRTDLVKFLADTAHELSAQARHASSDTASLLKAEAEELMAIRANLLDRHWSHEQASQMTLPLDVKAAA